MIHYRDKRTYDEIEDHLKREIDADILEQIRGLAETQPINIEFQHLFQRKDVVDDRNEDDKYLDRIGYK